MINPWNKIFEHDFRTAYNIANENYLQSTDDFQLRARATSSLLLGDYNNALADFLKINEIEKTSDTKYGIDYYDVTYMNIGLCYYAFGDVENAIEYFKFPIINSKKRFGTSDYSVPPCVLLFIGLKSGKQDIIELATKRLKNLETGAPGYLMGKLSETELDNVYLRESNETIRNRNHCKVEFYKAVHSLQNADYKNYKKHIQNCVELTGKYLEFEYYIAKVEYEIYLNGSDKRRFWQRLFNI